jgi:hypothetical protein
VSRPVIPFEPTWLDKHFRKALKALGDAEKEACLSRLSHLIDALKECSHPVQDPQLAPWSPSAYKGVVKIRSGHLAEYRFKGTLMRVIACYFLDRPEILLLTVTLHHDHDRMKRLLKEHGSSFSAYLPPS